jgi:MHS family citrate/tricarballylate:H+ symporter-like MFS transporter
VAISRTVRFLSVRFYASYISKAFFPTSSEFASLMLTFAVFGAGFLMRPLGAIVLGSYVDRIGRRQGLIVTLGIMACGTVLIAFVPDYSQIGLAAPCWCCWAACCRAFPPGWNWAGCRCIWPKLPRRATRALHQLAVGQPAGGHRGGGRHRLWHPAVAEPGADCRLGLARAVFIGCLIIPLIFLLRGSLQETDAFLARKHRPSLREIFGTIGLHWRTIVAGMFLVSLTTTLFYFITVYPDLWQERAAPERAGQPDCHPVRGPVQLCWLPIGGACPTASAANRCCWAFRCWPC